MAKRKDASKALGGMSGKAAAGLRGRAAQLKMMEEEAMGMKPMMKKAAPKINKSKKVKKGY